MPKIYQSTKINKWLIAGTLLAALANTHPASAQVYCTPASTIGTPYLFAFSWAASNNTGITNGVNVFNGSSSYTNSTGMGSVATIYRYFGATSFFAIQNSSNTPFPNGNVSLFIDWNNDGDFNDLYESVYSLATPVAVNESYNATAFISVPNNTQPGNYRLRYTYCQNGTPSACGAFTGETEDMLINVPVNTAPVMDNSGTPLLNSQLSTYTDSDGFTLDQLIFNNGLSYISDAQDISASQMVPRGIAINGQTATNGTWQYRIGATGTWTNIGAVSTTNVLLLSSNSMINATGPEVRLRFVPTGVGTPSLSFYAWDLSAGTTGTYADASTRGGSTAFSTASESASMSVVAPAGVPDFNIYMGSTQIDNILSAKLNRATSTAYEPQIILDSNANFTNLTDMDIDSVNNKLVWTESTTSDKIVRCNKDGSNVEILYSFPATQSIPNGIATSPQHLFFTENGASVVTRGVYRATLNGTGVTAITGGTNQLPTPNQIRDIEYSNGKLYVIARPTSTSEYKIYQIDTTGLNPTEVASTPNGPLSLAVANGQMYWGENPGTNNYLVHKPVSGGTKDTMVITNNRLVRDMTVDVVNNKLYYLDYYYTTPTDRYLNVIPLSGGAPTRLLNLPSSYNYIASDGMNTSTPLAINLSNFNGQAATGSNTLYWNTAAETEGQQFSLERSNDGKQFKAIHAQPGKGQAAHYSYIDNTPFNGNNYYRLFITETNGNSTYSKTIVLKQGNDANNVKVYPNPAHDIITIEGNYKTATVYDLSGKTMMQTTASSTINVTSLPTGMYILILKDDKGNEVYHQQMVKK